MSKPRPLDYGQIEKMRAEGLNWKQIADALGWSAASLKDRMNRDGWREKDTAAAAAVYGQAEAKKPKKPPLKEQVYAWLKTGVTAETIAASLGKTPAELAAALRCDLEQLRQKALAAAEIELAESIFNRALNGDKSAVSQYRRGVQ